MYIYIYLPITINIYYNTCITYLGNNSDYFLLTDVWNFDNIDENKNVNIYIYILI